MKKATFLAILILSFSACADKPAPNIATTPVPIVKSEPVNMPPPVKPNVEPSFDKNDSTYAAMKLISFDNDGAMPDKSSLEVQKAKNIIEALAAEFKVSAYLVFAAASAVAAVLLNTKNKEISRLKLIEGFKNLHFSLPTKNRKIARQKELQDLLTLYAEVMPPKN